MINGELLQHIQLHCPFPILSRMSLIASLELSACKSSLHTASSVSVNDTLDGGIGASNCHEGSSHDGNAVDRA